VINYKNIRHVHLELSTLCNAACPRCRRNFYGYPYNDGYPELNLSLANAEKIFTIDFLQQLKQIDINGNYGDIVMNSQGLQIVEYFKKHNVNLTVSISTNGSARNKSFWQGLAKAGAQVIFCIDGLEDTHHLYRQNTSWSTIIKNAKNFIEAGGCAIWKFIKFDHNAHQIDECRNLANKLKFNHFELILGDRNIGPVFDQQGNHTHSLGNYQGSTDFKIMFHKKKTDEVLVEDVVDVSSPKTHVSCKALTNKSIYISAYGEVSPCCWTGFAPTTSYGSGEYHQAVNSQLRPIISKNNALEYSLEECIEWFSLIQQAWNTKTYQQGRLVVCDDNCGS